MLSENLVLFEIKTIAENFSMCFFSNAILLFCLPSTVLWQRRWDNLVFDENCVLNTTELCRWNFRETDAFGIACGPTLGFTLGYAQVTAHGSAHGSDLGSTFGPTLGAVVASAHGIAHRPALAPTHTYALGIYSRPYSPFYSHTCSSQVLEPNSTLSKANIHSG